MLKELKLSYDSRHNSFIGLRETTLTDEFVNPVFVSIEEPELHAYSVQEKTVVYGDNEYTEDAGIINVFTIVGEGIDIDQSELEYEMKLKLMEMAEENMLKWQRILEELQKGEEFE